MKSNKFDYFKAFVDFSQKAYDAAEILDRSLRQFDPNGLPSQLDDIHRIEHQADDIRHEVVEHLSREFVAPIEREDILSLAQEFDNVVDAIDDVMRKMNMYRIKELRKDMLLFSDLLLKICRQLNELAREFVDFRKSKTIKERIISVHTVESQADTIHFDAVSNLFAADGDPIATIAWQSIYDAMEQCFDNCEQVAEVIEGVILKNS